MCEPVTLALAGASIATTVASSAMSIVGDTQRNQMEKTHADRVNKANRDQMQENRDLATRAYLDQVAEANRNLSETRVATAASNFDKSREAAQARSSALVNAAESGVSGTTLQALLNDFDQQEGMFLQRNKQNLLFKQQATASAVTGYRNEAEARIAQIKPIVQAPSQPVDYMGPILRAGNSIAQTGLSSYGSSCPFNI